ncbi:unnamed protein product [Moneuplotes crassus]|uniref:Uncharacterized protein n=1 Tax=Euplotes crassus TaxID=5936 RepID=A0AAD1XA71_EUPCR|nr:unnamed protein product [Moneuplotes crassus]
MDIGNFVPQHLKEYYEIANRNDADPNSSLDTRKPYKSVSEKSSGAKIVKCNKRGTQQFNFSRNFHPLKDITKNEANKKQPFESYQPKEKIIHDEINENANLNSSNRSPLKRFNFTADISQKLSSRSLANRNQTCKAAKKLFSFTQKHVNESLKLSEKSFDSSLHNYQNSDFNYNYQNQKCDTFNFETEEDASPDLEISKLNQRLNQAEIGYLKWKKCAEKQNKSIISYEKKVAELHKELKKASKKINKYKQLKEHSDQELKKLKESQQETLAAHTSKMKQMFLKEYEELMTEKTNMFTSSQSSSKNKLEDEISELTGKLTNSNLECRKLKSQIKELTEKLKEKEQEIDHKDKKIKDIEVLESRAFVNPILKEGLMNMEKCNKISSNLLTQYKEHIIKLNTQNATLNKKVKTLTGIEEKYEDIKQQNEIYEKELKELEDTVKMIEGQVDRQVCIKVQTECEALCKETAQLIDCLYMVLEGQEPNIDILLGFKPKCDLVEKEMDETYQDIRKVRRKVNEIRNTLCDHYATKYSSECNIQ